MDFLPSMLSTSYVEANALSFIPGGSVLSSEGFEIYSSKFKIEASTWSRVSEYTADRCAFLICNDIRAAVSAIKKQILNNSMLAE